ncbi:MAG TPA: SLC13 family permease, partial [Ardenticatenaceae bacterium]|nr:SLC13 family permease [Ardenticatenaceae bacterium]
KANGHYRFTVVGWMREGQRLRGPYATYTVQEGDVLLVHTTPEDMLAFRQEPGLDLHAVDKFGGTPSGDGHEADAADQLVQAVLAPQSDLIGRTLRDIDFRQRYGPVVVGLWRRGGFMREELARVPLAAGDVLVLQGDEASLGRVRQDRAFLMLVPFHGKVRLRRKARVAGLIMLSTILLAAFNILTLEIATLAGAVAMVLTRCVTMRQAYRAIDVRVYVFIAGAIPLGVAMQESGAAAVLATWFHGVVQNWSPTLILLAIFWIVAIATQLMSDAGTTALFAPVAVALAQGLGHNPGAYVVTVAMAAVAAFLTPIGHHGNLLIYGPGRYRFADFVRVGTPLTILVAVLVVWLAQVLWPP